MGIKPDNIGKKGDIWRYHMLAVTDKTIEYLEYHMLLECLNEAIRYPGDQPRYYWKTYNLKFGIFEELGIDYDPRYWKKVG